MPFERSPLFSKAGEEVQRQLRRRFNESDFGKLIATVERTYNKPAKEAEIQRVIRAWKGDRPERLLHQLMGADFTSLVRTVEKYARGGGGGGLGKTLLKKFIKSMGPAGNILWSLATANKSPAGYRSSLNDAMSLIRSMGGEVLPGKDWGTVEDVDRAVKAMEQRLKEMGKQAENIQETATPAKRIEPSPRSPDIQMAAGGNRRFPPNHPIITGDMVPTPGSSNVYEFGYDAATAYLYVRFKAPAPPKELRVAPGSLYRYRNVTPEEFLALYALRNHSSEGGGPGDWVWDNLRVRGTVSGHRKDYELVGVVGNYVPRKATLERENGKLVEYFNPRRIRTTEGKWLQSRKPRELAPTSGFMVGERGAGGGPRSGPNNPRG